MMIYGKAIEMTQENKNELTVQTSSIVELASTIENISQHMTQFQELKKKLLSPEDICMIQGRPFVKRSGWRKFALAFNLDDIIANIKREDFEGGFIYRFTVTITAPNGRSVDAVGCCSSNERKFNHPDHDVYAIAHTRAKNRGISDLIGSGEVSAEEMQADEDAPKPQIAAPVDTVKSELRKIWP